MNTAMPGAQGVGLRLDELARLLPTRTELVGDPSARVFGVRHDSRAVLPGDLFVARKGQRVDAVRFVDDALRRGAAAVMTGTAATRPSSSAIPFLLVDDVARGLAHAASLVYGRPSEALEVVGITGTNGKTTTAYLVRAAVDAALGRLACAMMGTVGQAFGSWQASAEHTTPEADDVARAMVSMHGLGASHLVMEVSSHAIELRRIDGVKFRIAALTNLTQDHLDFHGSMKAYGDVKRRLFTEHGPSRAVINIDDPFGQELAADMGRSPLRVSSRRQRGADVYARACKIDASGIVATVATPAGDVDIVSRLLGAHNLDNLLLGLGIAHALGLDMTRAAAGLSSAPPPPGRLERCDSVGDSVTVLVDYAHTPDALARVLQTLQRIASNRVWCVFGCGGDRDSTKRAPMGEVAARFADEAFITNDNPRSEDPTVIAAAIACGVRAAGRSPVVELDRRLAIEKAVSRAADGDIVLVAGKGHETYQIVGDERHPFDDREVARNALALRRQARELRRD